MAWDHFSASGYHFKQAPSKRITVQRLCRRAPSDRAIAPAVMAALMLNVGQPSQAATEAVGSPTPLAEHAMAFHLTVSDARNGAKDFSLVLRWLARQKRG